VETIHQLSDVFGVSRGIPLTYVFRQSVDSRFLEDLRRDKHVVVHGSSKQGKTCLRRQHLSDENHIRVQCTRDLSRAKLYELILKHAGVRVKASYSTTASTASTVGGGAEAKGKLPLFGSAKADVSIKRERASDDTTISQDLELDLNDPNDIIRVLDAIHFVKHIVIEDFHYLDEEVQRAFAFDLKVFHEVSALLFVIIGVWLETNRLIMFNGDLSGRIATIDADRWADEELRQILRAGAALLNIGMAADVQRALVKGCQQNVGLLQEACYKLCENASVLTTLDTPRTIGTPREVDGIYAEIAASQSARYRNFLVRFAEGLTSETKLQIYKWIAWAVITAEPTELRNGLKASTIFQRIASKHRHGATMQQSSVSQALDRVGNVQFKHKLQPLIFDYGDNRLRIVDANFILFVETQSRDDLMVAIGLKRPKAG
jgi:hypothetical protein